MISKTRATEEDNAIKRLMADHLKLANSEETGFYAEPSENSMLIWNGYVIGPEDSPYDGGRLELRLNFPKDYPQRPPEVKFTSNVLHPNIFFNGEICLEELEDEWDPNYDVTAILLLVRQLLREPDFSSPANPKATKIFRRSRKEYEEAVKACMKGDGKESEESGNKAHTIF